MLQAFVFYGIACCVTHFKVQLNNLQLKISNQQSIQECDATNDAQRAYAGYKK
jgi:hypothetical protein